MTWVVAEHTASSNGELTVTKGQQVEVIESCQGRADWWVVRIPGEPPQEGAVPAQVLKPQPQHHPQQKTSPSRRPLSQPCEEVLGKFTYYYYYTVISFLLKEVSCLEEMRCKVAKL